MDNEIVGLLKSIQNDMKSMQGGIKSMQGDIRSMQGDIRSMQGDIKSMQDDMKEMDGKIDKNTLILEDLRTKTETIAEVQDNHSVQNEKQHKEIKVTMQNTYDVAYLKMAK